MMPNEKYTDLPPRISRMIGTMQTHVKVLYGIMATLATGLVGVTVHCFTH